MIDGSIKAKCVDTAVVDDDGILSFGGYRRIIIDVFVENLVPRPSF
jgi:hypothetical protein